jgi:hypothetical protein
MDYSLLLGIETQSVEESLKKHNSEIFKLRLANSSSCKKKACKAIDVGEVFAENHKFKFQQKVFHISIIDYL